MKHIDPFPNPKKDEFLVNIVVETPRGQRHKFAYDPHSKLFALRMTIPEGLSWPYDYGFIPGTLGEDGDPLDILFMGDEPTFSGCLTQGRLLGIVRMEKDGIKNDRLLACAKRIDGVYQSTDPYDKVDDVPIIDSLVHFLVQYSEGTGHKVIFKDVDGRRKALDAIHTGIDALQKKHAEAA